ncbi:glyoxalase-like domain-containing protein [Annulohypoxylon maeteangense]|uniref:glyoxalase-like domain-containing protein n=1 Tax=Annulohypoxylon maeteangense TaxID=1927788 RepID=UPI00200736C9|nr:glyoxalase-like domain-containing protein [Annulohypoxylon maeteangense]KAI0887032.1 glyoxalase-like domain-containing protein [Annulohypoxylon maeteangense]
MAASTATTPLVDHIVILVPHSFLSAPPSWFSEVFHFHSGGRHADGRTENSLVYLPDGAYLEFIAFVPGIDPADRATHHWGSKKEGTVVDWAVTLPSTAEDEAEREQEGAGKGDGRELRLEKLFREVQRKVREQNTGIVYGDLRRGGRTKPDGAILKWSVAFAKREDGEPLELGTVPFWCLDVTPRHLRVPFEEPGNAKHPSGVVGVAKVEVHPELSQTAERAKGVYNALFEEKQAEDEWKLSSLAGEKVHPGAVVSLGASDNPAKIDITFFTDDESWAGKSVGGKIDGENTLTFHLVATSKGK